MTSFQYRLRQLDGQTDDGLLEAHSRQEALSVLTARGQLLKLDEQQIERRSLRDVWQAWRRTRSMSRRDLTISTRQLSALLAAGVPLAAALGHLVAEAPSETAGSIWRQVSDLVAEGASLADAMAQAPRTFPNVYVAMVRAGETGGFLDLVLTQIADFQEREQDLKSKLLTAITYPLILIGMSVAVLSFLMIYFIPKFQTIFSDFGAQLPALTRAIVAISDFLRGYGAFLLLIVAALLVVLRQKLQTEAGRRWWESLLLQTPVVKPLLASFAMTRFCRTLGTLTGAGVPLLTALRVARESLGYQVLIDALGNAVNDVQKGTGLADSLAGCNMLFSRSALHIIAISEQTGKLDSELQRLATTTERELDGRLRLAMTFAEPALLFVMATIVGTIVVGMVLPIFSLQDYIK